MEGLSWNIMMEHPTILIDDSGVPLYQEISIWVCLKIKRP